MLTLHIWQEVVSIKIMVTDNIYYKNQLYYKGLQPNSSTETHDVYHCNALNREHNKYTIHTKKSKIYT